MIINLADPNLELKLKVWDAVIKGVTAVIFICTAIYGVKSYLTQNRHYQEQRAEDTKRLIEQNKRYEDTKIKEFNTTIYKARLDIYTEIVDAAARFATANDAGEAGKAAQRFWQLFDGKSSLLEDQLVMETMLLYGDMLEAWDDCDAKDKKDGPPNTFDDATYNLALACRLNLMEAFPAQVMPLQYATGTTPITVDLVREKNKDFRAKFGKICEKG